MQYELIMTLIINDSNLTIVDDNNLLIIMALLLMTTHKQDSTVTVPTIYYITAVLYLLKLMHADRHRLIIV